MSDTEARALALERVRDAVVATAPEISARGSLDVAPFKEKNLQEVFVYALSACLASNGEVVKESASVKFEHWPGVGPVDVAVLSDGTPQAFAL